MASPSTPRRSFRATTLMSPRNTGASTASPHSPSFQRKNIQARYQAQQKRHGGCGLALLSAELLIQILKLCPGRDVARWMRVCKFLMSVISESLALKYSMELSAQGLAEGPSADFLPTTEKLEILYGRKEPSQPEFVEKTIVVAGKVTGYLQQKGVITLSIPVAHTGPLSKRRRFESYRLEEDQLQMVASCSPSVTPTHFTTDPNQDLLLLLEFRPPSAGKVYKFCLYVRTMSTGLPHPLAVKPDFEIITRYRSGPGEYYDRSHEAIGLRGTYMACCCSMYDGGPWMHFRLWEWTSGQLLYFIDGAYEASFSFLDDHSFALTALECEDGKNLTTKWNIQIFTCLQPIFRSSASSVTGLSAPRLKWARSPTFGDGRALFEKVVLSLPVFKDKTVLTDLSWFNIRSGDNDCDLSVPLSMLERAQCRRLTDENALFVQSGEEKIVSLNFKMCNGVECYSIVSPASSIAGLARQNAQQGEIVRIPWREWGPKRTRWIRRRSEHGFERISGLCYSSWMKSGPTVDGGFSVMNFNLAEVLRSTTAPETDDPFVYPANLVSGSSQRVLSRHVMELPTIFKSSIASELPLKQTLYDIRRPGATTWPQWKPLGARCLIGLRGTHESTTVHVLYV